MIAETNIRRADPGITIFEISGRLNLGNTLVSIEYAIKELIGSGSRRIIIDLTHLKSIDSSGIGVMVACAGEMDRHGGKIRIAGAHDAVARVFGVVHLDRILPLDIDVESACRMLASTSAAV